MIENESTKSTSGQIIKPELIIVVILLLELVGFIFNIIGGSENSASPGAGIGIIVGILIFLMFTLFLINKVEGKRILVYTIFRFLAFIVTVDIWLNSDMPGYDGFFISYLLISTIALFYLRRIIKRETNLQN